MDFTKVQSVGNDFVLVEAADIKADWPKVAVAMCHRHLGIGADGTLLLLPSKKADFRMRVFNSDGSEAEACGNGLRCFVAYLHQLSSAPQSHYRIATGAGILDAEYKSESGLVRVNMGSPRLEAEALPALGFAKNPVLKEKLEGTV